MVILCSLHQTILNPGKNNDQNPMQWDINLHNRQSTITWVSHMFIKILTVTNLHNRQSTITWVSNTFIKRLTKTVTCEFVSDS